MELAGATFLVLTVGRELEEVFLSVNDAAADPHLDADAAVGGMCLRTCVVNVGTKRVERGSALLEVLRTGDFGTAETTGHGHLDTLWNASCCR